MRTVLLCIFALIAFAANSILNRSALALEQIGPAAFLSIRLISGAAMLGILVAFKNRAALLQKPDWRGAGSLLLYMVGFSYAYISLDTGTGALILFGGVQITMFAGALLSGERPSIFRWAGSILGLTGLAILFLPGATAPSLLGALLMIAAAVGWGIYSLIGKGSKAPLEQTALNFVAAAPLGLLLWLAAPIEASATAFGISLAILSGAIASALGYAVWYSLLPKIDASLAAVAQLTVPIIALLGGMLFLSEPFTIRFLIASVLILGGVALALVRKRAV